MRVIWYVQTLCGLITVCWCCLHSRNLIFILIASANSWSGPFSRCYNVVLSFVGFRVYLSQLKEYRCWLAFYYIFVEIFKPTVLHTNPTLINAVFYLKFSVSAIVEHNYIAKESDELTLIKGAIINNIKRQLGGWWEGTLASTGKTGMFPDNFVRVLESDDKSPVVLR